MSAMMKKPGGLPLCGLAPCYVIAITKQQAVFVENQLQRSYAQNSVKAATFAGALISPGKPTFWTELSRTLANSVKDVDCYSNHSGLTCFRPMIFSHERLRDGSFVRIWRPAFYGCCLFGP